MGHIPHTHTQPHMASVAHRKLPGPELCFECGKPARGACAICRVATYCGEMCAAKALQRGRHRAACNAYVRMFSPPPARAPVEATFTALGWPSFLDAEKDRTAFEQFVRARSPFLPPPYAQSANAMEPVQRRGDIPLVLDLMWACLTPDQKLAWQVKANLSGTTDARAAFDGHTHGTVAADLLSVRSKRYPNDTLMKQVWRNMEREVREFYGATNEFPPLPSSGPGRSRPPEKKKKEEKEEEERDEPPPKKRRMAPPVAPEVVDAVVAYMQNDRVPREVAMAIINNLPGRDVLAAGIASKNLMDIVHELLFLRDFVPHARYTAGGEALVRAARAEGKRRAAAAASDRVHTETYYAAVDMLAAYFTEGAVGEDFNDEKALRFDDESSHTALFHTSNVAPPVSREQYAEWLAVHPQVEFARTDAFFLREDTLMGLAHEHLFEFDLDSFVGDRVYIPHDSSYAKERTNHFERRKTDLERLGADLQGAIFYLLEEKHGKSAVQRTYGAYYRATGMRANVMFSDTVDDWPPGAVAVFSTLTKALAKQRFGFGTYAQSGGTQGVRDALAAFFRFFITNGLVHVFLVHSDHTIQFPFDYYLTASAQGTPVVPLTLVSLHHGGPLELPNETPPSQ